MPTNYPVYDETSLQSNALGVISFVHYSGQYICIDYDKAT